MLEWIGGSETLVELSLPLLGLLVLGVIRRYATPNRAWPYLFASFCCWFGFHLVLGLYSGSLVPVPYWIGLSTSILLLVGFLGWFVLAIVAAWRDENR